jgi:hypothetical protein
LKDIVWCCDPSELRYPKKKKLYLSSIKDITKSRIRQAGKIAQLARKLAKAIEVSLDEIPSVFQVFHPDNAYAVIQALRPDKRPEDVKPPPNHDTSADPIWAEVAAQLGIREPADTDARTALVACFKHAQQEFPDLLRNLANWAEVTPKHPACQLKDKRPNSGNLAMRLAAQSLVGCFSVRNLPPYKVIHEGSRCIRAPQPPYEIIASILTLCFSPDKAIDAKDVRGWIDSQAQKKRRSRHKPTQNAT